jgi:hypothetical protein
MWCVFSLACMLQSLLEGKPLPVWPMESGYVRPFTAITAYIQALSEYSTCALPLMCVVYSIS